MYTQVCTPNVVPKHARIEHPVCVVHRKPHRAVKCVCAPRARVCVCVCVCVCTGKPVVDSGAAGAGPAKPSWVRDECSAAWSLLAANFPSLIQAAEMSDGQLWGSWAAGAEDEGAYCLLP